MTTMQVNNASSSVYSVGKVVGTALKEAQQKSGREPPELQILREKCKDVNYIISHSGCQGIVALAESGFLPIPKALSTLIALLPSVKVLGSVINAVGQLMILDLNIRHASGLGYKCPFNLHSPQHPLLTILKWRDSSWDEVINQIASIANSTDDVLTKHGCDVVRPVALFMICDPISTANDPPAYHQPLWNMLLSLKNQDLTHACLPWLQIHSTTAQSLLVQLASVKAAKKETDATLALTLATFAHLLVSAGKNPQAILTALNQQLTGCSVFLGSCVVMIMAHAITVSAPNHLIPLLTTCQLIIEQNKCCSFAGYMLRAALLPFMACPSPLTAEPLRLAQQLLEKLKSAPTSVPANVELSTHPSHLAHLCIRTCILASNWSSATLFKWLKMVQKAPAKFQIQSTLVIGTFLICTENGMPALPVCLEILVDIARNNPELIAPVLTWLLSRLSQEKQPECQLALLKALPRLGKQKENVSLIINTLESLRSEAALQPLVLNLYLIMWKLEPRVFPYLHKILQIESLDIAELQHNWDIVRAHTIKEICVERPNQHGKDLVGILSGILNRCTGPDGATACSLALEAIAALCSATVVDVASTWKVLAPRLAPDLRPAVVKSLCGVLGLMSEVPSNHPEQAKLWTDVQTRLWYYSACGLSHEVSEAAFKALGRFSLEELYLATVPAPFKKNLAFPPDYTKSATDSSKTPEEVLSFIPGVCWPQVLAVLPTSTILVAKLLAEEITSLRGALQRVPGKAEPALPQLNIYSVFLGLLKELKKSSATDLVVPNILKVLAEPMPKQFPACDWTFLEDFAKKNPKLLVACLKVSASQAHVSPSALKVVEALVKEASTMGLEMKDMVELFSTLEMLGKTIEPTTLRNFVEAHVRRTIEFGLSNEAHLDVLHKVFGHIKSTLRNDDVLEINQKLLALTLDDLMSELSWKDKQVFLPYNDCVSQMHSKFLNEMTSPTTWSESNPQKLQNAIAIRTWIAANSDENSLNWVNECIEGCSDKSSEHEFLFRNLIPALVNGGKNVADVKEWLLQLMAQIHSSLMDSRKIERGVYLCDVWSLAVLTLSGHLAHGNVVKGRETRLQLLPQAVLGLVQLPNISSLTLQIIEWLHCSIMTNRLPVDLSDTFYKCLQILRHEDAMKKPGLWTKIVSV